MRLHCSKCGKTVSTDVADETIVRAWIECPECIQEGVSKEGFDRDIKLFVLWYTDMLLFGQKISSELKQ